MENKTQLNTQCTMENKRTAIVHIIITFLLAVTILAVTYVWPKADFVNGVIWYTAVMYSISGMGISKRIGRFYE